MQEEEMWVPVLQLWSFDLFLRRDKLYNFDRGHYYVSNHGRFMRNGNIRTSKPDSLGYSTYSMNGHRFKLHQIMMQSFYPDGIKDGVSVNHIDRNPRNNHLSNLRWADKKTQVYNRENKEYKYKKVMCMNNNKIYKSCQEAEADLGLVRNTVSRVARGERKSIHGYKFVFVSTF